MYYFTPPPDPGHEWAMRIAGFVTEAMNAGLNGKRLPDFGAPLSPATLAVINGAYEDGRNRHAGAGAAVRSKK